MTKKHIFALLLLFGFCQIAEGEELSSHIVNNILIGGKKSPYPKANTKKFAVICADSLSFGNAEKGCTALLDFNEKTYTKTYFVQKSNKWSFSNEVPANLQKIEQKDFVEFIQQFSNNKDYQINHTVFPFPVNTMNGKEQIKRKLIMPRDWEQLPFSNTYPQMYLFKAQSDGSNRKIYIYRNGVISEMYNFIRINKQWYLIEKYEYE